MTKKKMNRKVEGIFITRSGIKGNRDLDIPREVQSAGDPEIQANYIETSLVILLENKAEASRIHRKKFVFISINREMQPIFSLKLDHLLSQ